MENGSRKASVGHEVNRDQLEGQKGSLTPAKKWRLKTEIKKGVNQSLVGYCTDVAVYSTGDIIFVDNEHDRIVTLSPDGQQLKVNSSKAQPDSVYISNLRGIVVNKDDQLLVLDDETVKIFSQDYELIHKFTSCKGCSAIPSCIAVDSNGQIAVGDNDNDDISLYNSDGTCIRNIPAAMIDDYLTVDNKQNLLYTNFHKKKLLSIDFRGNEVFSIDTVDEDDTPIHPLGVSCDSRGDIYISTQNRNLKKENGEIHHYDPDGKYKGRVIQGLDDPFGIVFTPSGDLVVADGQSVKVFHYI